MNDIEIIGNGNIGDKARQLVEKTPKLKDIGFYVPRRTVLAEDYFDGFFQRNGLGENLRSVEIVEDLEAKIRSGSLTREEFQALQGVSSSYGNSPLAVRSSAEGDSRGTGTYKSEFTENQIGHLRKSVQKVLASYFSEDAVAFRRDAKTGDGFGVLVEPIIGQDIDWCFAPVLSGFGYTSTSRGDGYVNIVPGLGGGVDTRDGERITEDVLKQFGGNLEDYLHEERSSMFSMFGGKTKRNSALLRTDSSWSFDRSYSGNAYHAPNRWNRGDVCRTSLNFEEAELDNAFRELNLNPLFEMMKRMEDNFGKPQYFEWAMTLENRKPKYWITQIADVNKKLDTMDFEDLGDIIFMGHTVTGTGAKECYKIANCWNPDDVGPLYDFNQNHRDYVLLFSSRLTTCGNKYLHYSAFNNASVFIEIQDARHTGDPVAHLGGQLDMTGKLFGVLDYDAEVPPQWDKFDSREKDESGIRVYQGKVKVVASERQNKMVVSALD